MGYGYGYPQFNYYAPGVYYLGEVFHLVGFQFVDVVKILFIIGFVLSGIFMYVLVREIFGELPALVASLFYVYGPVRAVQVYVRGSLSEFWVAVFFPLVVWAAIKLVKSQKNNHLVLFSLSVGSMFVIHNLLPWFFLPVSLFIALFFLPKKNKLKSVTKLFWGIVLAFGLAAFFLIPVFLEIGYVHTETLLGGYFDYRRHFVSIKQLFLANNWGFGSSDIGSGDELNLALGLLHWPVAFLGILVLLAKRKLDGIAKLVIPTSLAFLVFVFLIHSRSHFVWEMFAVLAYLQFPWRFLVLTNFLLALLVGISAFYFSENKKIAFVLVGLVFVFYGSFFAPKDWFPLSDREKFSGSNWERQLTISIFDYLPVSASAPPESKASELPEVLEGEASLLSYTRGSNFQEGKVVSTGKSLLRIPIFDFPGMVASVDGYEVPVLNDCRGQKNCLGLVTIEVPSGEHIVKVRLTDTLPRTLGNVISLVSLIFLVGIWKKSKSL